MVEIKKERREIPSLLIFKLFPIVVVVMVLVVMVLVVMMLIVMMLIVMMLIVMVVFANLNGLNGTIVGIVPIMPGFDLCDIHKELVGMMIDCTHDFDMRKNLTAIYWESTCIFALYRHRALVVVMMMITIMMMIMVMMMITIVVMIMVMMVSMHMAMPVMGVNSNIGKPGRYPIIHKDVMMSFPGTISIFHYEMQRDTLTNFIPAITKMIFSQHQIRLMMVMVMMFTIPIMSGCIFSRKQNTGKHKGSCKDKERSNEEDSLFAIVPPQVYPIEHIDLLLNPDYR